MLSHDHYSSLPTVPRLKRADKSGTLQRRKSITCDGDFVRSLQAKGFFAATTRRGYHVVVGRLPVSLPCTHPESTQLKPKRWRDTGEEIHGLFFHAALASHPHVKAFTLMLSRPVEALARAKGKHCLAWLHRRMVRQLKPLGALYRQGAVPFWFAIEESSVGRLHIHGEICIGQDLGDKRTVRQLRRVLAPIRKALKATGGQWVEERDGEGTQLRFSRGTPDFRWAGYCLKGVHKARPGWRRLMRGFGSPRGYVVAFEGKAVTASEGLKRSAINQHEAAVE